MARNEKKGLMNQKDAYSPGHRGGGGAGTVIDDWSTKEEVWDHHSSYQWTYFVEEIKQFIDFYLSKRLSGRNLDIGGGWYLSYINSDVVDVSSVALKYNMAPNERKHHLDLDDLSNCKKLPFEDNTFDSATMISVIQYLRYPWNVIEELKRVLKPGAELYVIGGQDAGLYELRTEKGFDSIKEIKARFTRKNYDILEEPIPTPGGSTTEFSSICVAMPDENGVSSVKDKARRQQEAMAFDSKKFLRDWTSHEEKIELSKLMEIQTYPKTKCAKDMLERIDSFTKEYTESTGNTAIFFHDGIPQEFYMQLPRDHTSVNVATLARRESKRYPEISSEALKRHGIKASSYIGFLPGTLDDLEHMLKRPDDEGMDHLARFMAVTKLNSSALELEKRIWESVMQSGTFDYLLKVHRSKAMKFYNAASQHSQRRMVDDLIKRKKYLESRPELVLNSSEVDLNLYAHLLRNIIRPRPNYVEYD